MAVQGPEKKEINIFETHIILEEDDEESSTSPENLPGITMTSNQPPSTAITNELQMQDKSNDTWEFQDLPYTIPDEPEPKTLHPHDKMLQWHYHLGHTSSE